MGLSKRERYLQRSDAILIKDRRSLFSEDLVATLPGYSENILLRQIIDVPELEPDRKIGPQFVIGTGLGILLRLKRGSMTELDEALLLSSLNERIRGPEGYRGSSESRIYLLNAINAVPFRYARLLRGCELPPKTRIPLLNPNERLLPIVQYLNTNGLDR